MLSSWKICYLDTFSEIIKLIYFRFQYNRSRWIFLQQFVINWQYPPPTLPLSITSKCHIKFIQCVIATNKKKYHNKSNFHPTSYQQPVTSNNDYRCHNNPNHCIQTHLHIFSVSPTPTQLKQSSHSTKTRCYKHRFCFLCPESLPVNVSERVVITVYRFQKSLFGIYFIFVYFIIFHQLNFYLRH